MKVGKSHRKTLLIGLIVPRGNRITAGTNCHGCVRLTVGQGRWAPEFRRDRKSPGFSTMPRKRSTTTNNAIVSSARPFHDIAHGPRESKGGGQCVLEIKIAKCPTAAWHSLTRVRKKRPILSISQLHSPRSCGKWRYKINDILLHNKMSTSSSQIFKIILKIKYLIKKFHKKFIV